MVRSDTCCDGDFEFLCFGETFGGQVSWMESVSYISINQSISMSWFSFSFFVERRWGSDCIRSGDDDLCINEFFIEFTVLAIFIRCGDQCMAFGFEPLSNTQFVLSCSKELGDLFGMLVAVVED